MHATSAPDRTTAEAVMVPVWDPLVRVFHWTLAVAFFVAYFSGEGSLVLVVGDVDAEREDAGDGPGECGSSVMALARGGGWRGGIGFCGRVHDVSFRDGACTTFRRLSGVV